MAHGRDGPDIVMTIRYATASDVKAVTDHELNRSPDGSSAIDPARSSYNMILHGPESQQAALDRMRAAGVRGPAAQSEAPYVQMVLSASASYFRPNGEGPGDWDDGALDLWRDVTMEWLQREYGADLAHVSMHLDEDTPHMHVLIVPTYEKKARRPGRQKKNETDEEFGARVKAAEERSAIRTIGRSSNAYWSQNWARRNARKSYHSEVERQGLGLGYGRDFVEEGQPSPANVTTGHWVRQQAADNALAQNQLDADMAALAADRSALTEDRTKFVSDYDAALNKVKKWSEHVKSDRIKLNAERKYVQKLSQRLSALFINVEKALNVVAEFAPRIRRVLKDAEASRKDRIDAAAARAEITDVVPELEDAQQKIRDIMLELRDSPTLEQAFDPVEHTGPSIDGP